MLAKQHVFRVFLVDRSIIFFNHISDFYGES